MRTTIQQLEDLKEWSQDSTRYERRLAFRKQSMPGGMGTEAGTIPIEWDELSDREIEYYRTGPWSTREDYSKGQLVQPGPGRQGYMGNPQGNPLLGTKYTGTQHKGKILSKNAAKLKRLKELIKESNSSYTKNLTAHEILVKAGWKGGYQDIGTYQKIRPEVAKAMKKFQTTFEKMDNYVTNVMLAEDAFVKDFRNPQKHLAEKFGVSRGTMDNWANGNPQGTWKGSKVWGENKKLFKALGKELSFNKYKSLPDGTPRLMWDYSEIIQNKLPTAFGDKSLPHTFIMDSAHRHNKYAKHAGKSSQVRFIDKNYELLPRSEWKFIKGDKLYSMDAALDDVVYDGTTYKNNYLNHADAAKLYKNDFGEVYKVFDDLDTYMNTMVDGPDGKPIKLDTLLRRQAYDETGKKDFLKRRFAEIDHFDIDKKPFSDLRLLDRQTNIRAGILKRFEKYKNNPKLLNKTLTDIGYLNRDKDAAAFIKRMTKKVTVRPKDFLKLAPPKSTTKTIPAATTKGRIDEALKGDKFKGMRNLLKGELWFAAADFLNNLTKGQSVEKAFNKAKETALWEMKDLDADEKALIKHATEQGASEEEVGALRNYLNYMKKYKTYERANKMLDYAKKNLGEGTGSYEDIGTTWDDVTDAAQNLKLREGELENLYNIYTEGTGDMQLGRNMLDKYMKTLAAEEWNKTAGTLIDRGSRPHQGEGLIWGLPGAITRDIGSLLTGKMPTNFWDWAVPAQIDPWTKNEKQIRIMERPAVGTDYPEYNMAMEDMRLDFDYALPKQNYAGGGIAGIRRPWAIPPESGPDPQGLASMNNYVTKRTG